MPMTETDRSVYAAVGLALQWAQLFEAEMVTVLLAHGVARGEFRVRKEAEEFLRTAERKSLSRVLKTCLDQVRFEPDVSGTFEEAREARNFLVHRFFWDRAEEFADDPRHAELLEELRELTQLFFSAHKFAEILRELYLKQMPLPEG